MNKNEISLEQIILGWEPIFGQSKENPWPVSILSTSANTKNYERKSMTRFKLMRCRNSRALLKKTRSLAMSPT